MTSKILKQWTTAVGLTAKFWKAPGGGINYGVVISKEIQINKHACIERHEQFAPDQLVLLPIGNISHTDEQRTEACEQAAQLYIEAMFHGT